MQIFRKLSDITLRDWIIILEGLFIEWKEN
jgi:hypothetical protein